MRIVFMGTPEFALPTLKSIYFSEHQVVAVITQPDKPNKRGKKIIYSPIKQFANDNGLSIMQPDDIKDNKTIEAIQNLHPDILVVVAYGQLLPEALLQYPKYGSINIHGSLLPKYRGSAPIHWSIIQGEEEAGVTTMYMDSGMDTGDIIYKEGIKIDENTTVESLHDKLSEMGAKLLLKTLKDIENGTAPRIPQDNEKSTYAPLLTKNTGEINWKEYSSLQIFNLVRGTTPWPGAYTFYNGDKIKITKTTMYNCGDLPPGISPGILIDYHKGKGLLVKTIDGGIYLEKIHLANKKEMYVDEYLKGNSMEMGILLGV